MKRIAVVCGIILMMVTGVFAVDLKNEDSSSYDIKIHDGPTTTSTSIEGNTTRVSICSDCKIEVVGVGTVEASGDAVVVIKNGEVSVE